MFYVQKIDVTFSTKKVLVDDVLVSENSESTNINTYLKVGQDNNEYINNFSERTLFASLQDLYNVCPKKMNLNLKTLTIELLPDPDFSFLSKEEGIKEINDCLNYSDRLIGNTTVEYIVVEE